MLNMSCKKMEYNFPTLSSIISRFMIVKNLFVISFDAKFNILYYCFVASNYLNLLQRYSTKTKPMSCTKSTNNIKNNNYLQNYFLQHN